MTLLEELNQIMSNLAIPVETGIFSSEAPNQYVVLIPLDDMFALDADNTPNIDIQSVRISIYSKGNYRAMKNSIIKALIDADITITERVYVEFEEDTHYHHYSIDTSNYYGGLDNGNYWS